MPVIEILLLTTGFCFLAAFVLYIVGQCLENKRPNATRVIDLIACVIVIISVICGFATMALDMHQKHTTEYVNCERCGSRVPAAEYETGE